jgi:hypothetical protein
MLYAQWVQETVAPPAETGNGPAVGIPNTGDNGSVLYGWLLCAASLACIATRKVYRKHQARHKQ